VPLSSITTSADSRLRAHGEHGELVLPYAVDVVFGSLGDAAALTVSTSELVFAGYGIVAPEYGWDDYAGVDVRGKTVIVLSGDPGPTRDEPQFFKGLALTHHGTHKAKAELARARGAKAVLGVHDSEASGLPWELIAGNSQQAKMQLRDSADAAARESIGGVLPTAKARELLALAGLDFDALREAAKLDGFRPSSAALSLEFSLARSFEAIDSHNLVAWLPGAERPNEYVIYTAHWDHVGVAPEGGGRDGDRIFNGAVDNATGTAALLELAQAYATLEPRPARSIVFLAVTAEEQGLLGSFHYADHPSFPLADTIAVINMAVLFPFGASKGMTVVALGSSELEEYMASAAEAVGRRLYADPAPQLGAFFRSDHYPFAAKGVPAIFAVGGPAQDPEVGETVDIARFMEYVQQHYHQVSDEYDPARWDLAGIVQDVEVYFRTGLAIANDARVPNWYETSEFRALRDAMRP
jgi:Zn-dependent M28 family amino/carboxypeptidase